MLPDNFKEQVRDAVNIVDYIGRTVKLKKGGAYWNGICPFHKDSSPSFRVSISRRRWKCFGCNRGGDIFDFVMERDGVDFPTAQRMLASQFGVPIPETAAERTDRKLREQLFKIMAEAQGVYWNGLKAEPRTHEYLKSRGFTGRSAWAFGIGFAAENCLRDWFGADYGDDAFLEGDHGCGLTKIGEDSRRRDFFQNRLTFPIRDERGRVLGFSGRTFLPGDNRHGKYINSPATALYQKNRTLYGIYENAAGIREAGKIVMVEGYLDVIRLHQAGLPLALAPCGTALTEEQVDRVLKFHAADIYLCFDGDDAGRAATRKAAELFLSRIPDGQRVHVIALPSPDGEKVDPDSYVLENGADGFRKLMDEAEPLADYVLRPLREAGEDMTEKSKALSALVDLTNRMTAAPSLQSLIRAKLMKQGPGVEKRFDRAPKAQTAESDTVPSPAPVEATPEQERDLGDSSAWLKRAKAALDGKPIPVPAPKSAPVKAAPAPMPDAPAPAPAQKPFGREQREIVGVDEFQVLARPEAGRAILAKARKTGRAFGNWPITPRDIEEYPGHYGAVMQMIVRGATCPWCGEEALVPWGESPAGFRCHCCWKNVRNGEEVRIA